MTWKKQQKKEDKTIQFLTYYSLKQVKQIYFIIVRMLIKFFKKHLEWSHSYRSMLLLQLSD